MNYFIIENGQQAGPFTIDQLRSKGVTGETNVWREGMAQWGKAKDIPEIASILQLGTTPPPPPCTPNYSQHSQQPPQYGHNTPQPTQPCPDNHLGLSIAATIITLICCFPLPIGIIAFHIDSFTFSFGSNSLCSSSESTFLLLNTSPVVLALTSALCIGPNSLFKNIVKTIKQRIRIL